MLLQHFDKVTLEQLREWLRSKGIKVDNFITLLKQEEEADSLKA